MDERQQNGLDGVVAADTRLSLVDGAHGRLIIAGKTVDRLAWEDGYEGAATRLWQGLVENTGTKSALSDALGQARVAAFADLAPRFSLLAALEPIEALRAGAALIADNTTDVHLRIVGALPVLLAATLRQRQGLAPVAPDATLSTAADLLRMVRGVSAAASDVEGLDVYLATVSDHGFNASTFTARVIASTQSGLASAVTGAIGALKGPLHGGAPGPVLDMLDAIGTPDCARSWLGRELDAGRRLMGFGHRIYRVRDPRADVLRSAVARFDRQAGRIALAEAIEREALSLLALRQPGRRLDTNVEFYTALLLDAVGLPRDSFTAVFAVGRVIGWIAHALEQQRYGRLIRPESRYIGPQPDHDHPVAA